MPPQNQSLLYIYTYNQLVIDPSESIPPAHICTHAHKHIHIYILHFLGGGLLGIAHVGFICVLEEAGIRFLGLGGASVGAIIASIMSVVRKTPLEMSWHHLLAILATVQFSNFEDGDPFWVHLREDYNCKDKKSITSLNIIWRILSNWRTITKAWTDMGLHPGKRFHEWLKDIMERYGVHNQKELDERMRLDLNLIRVRGDCQVCTLFQRDGFFDEELRRRSVAEMFPCAFILTEPRTERTSCENHR